MKNALFINTCILISSLFLLSFLPEPECKVKYNGIYAYKLDNEYSAVIRFYDDGTVLASTSVNDYMDVFDWFHKENKEMVLAGKYNIKKSNIKFDVSGVSGEQNYDGAISENTISIKLTDKKSKKTAIRTYTFYAL